MRTYAYVIYKAFVYSLGKLKKIFSENNLHFQEIGFRIWTSKTNHTKWNAYDKNSFVRKSRDCMRITRMCSDWLFRLSSTYVHSYWGDLNDCSQHRR